MVAVAMSFLNRHISRDWLWRLGQCAGCHQLPERSFFWRGRQFPVCARCTGVVIGQVASVILIFLFRPPAYVPVICCGILFADWFIQYIGLRPSTNIRRCITGIFGGYGMATLSMLTVIFLYHKI